jgi:hypothetical protein
MKTNLNSELVQVPRVANSNENNPIELSAGRAILPVYTIYDRCNVPTAHARVATFINPISKGEDRRAHHEMTIAGCEGGKCVLPVKLAEDVL